jgi:putative ABC transport system substrate-binding protein
MGKALAVAMFLAVAAIAGGCAESSAAAAAGKRVIVVNPRTGGPVDARALAARISAETGAAVGVRDVDVLSADAARAAARSIVAQRPALIVATSSEMVFALRDETQTLPILFVTLADPIQTGLIADDRRPRGNVSGFSFHVPVGPKQLELLLRAFPQVRRVGVIGDRTLFSSTSFRLLSEAAREPLHVEIERAHFENAADLDRVFSAAAVKGVDAWIVPEGGAAFRFARELVARIDATGRPAIYGSERFVRLGGLMSYSPQFEDPSDRVAHMARSILQGFPVGDLPVERPQGVRLAINTAAWARFTPQPPRNLLVLATDFYPSDARP